MHESATSRQELSQAYQYCISLARQHYENFPTASRLIRKELRPAVAAIYAFARHADDLADEGEANAVTRLKQLDAWETLLERCVQEQLDQPIFLALGDSIHKHQLPVEQLHNLLIAFRMDTSLHAYASEEELMFYCAHSANPVGRLMLALHNISSPEAIQASDTICTALQLINFWQDLSVDLPRGRCYLPDALLQANSLSAQQLLDWAKAGELESTEHNAAIQPVLKLALELAGKKLSQGFALLPSLPFRLRLQIAATLHAGQRMLDKIGQLDMPLAERASLHSGDWRRLGFAILMDALIPPKTLLVQPA
ncbi:MAG TPA: squalene synthase HpnC [Mariprofundaceae bacterium]|nr:squalene synthase HpnC [Mariprofundaceae bacterium]